MIIANSIEERKTLKAVAWKLREDGKWEGAETASEKAALLPVIEEKPTVELIDERAEVERIFKGIGVVDKRDLEILFSFFGR